MTLAYKKFVDPFRMNVKCAANNVHYIMRLFTCNMVRIKGMSQAKRVCRHPKTNAKGSSLFPSYVKVPRNDEDQQCAAADNMQSKDRESEEAECRPFTRRQQPNEVIHVRQRLLQTCCVF